MPISQDRMKRLIDAAQSVIGIHIGQCATLGELAASYRAGKTSLEDLLLYVEMRNVRPDAAIASEQIIINQEHYHWLATHNRNDQEARRLARRRAEARGETYSGEPTRPAIHPPRKQKATKSLERENRAEAQPKRTSNAAQLEHLNEINSDDDLGFGAPTEQTEGEPILPPNYTPKELDPETKAKIEAEMEAARLAREVLAQIGRSGDGK